MSKRSMQGAVVYVIGEWRYPTSKVKIGFSSSGFQGAVKRMNAMQTGNPRRLAIIALMQGDRELERDLHSKHSAAHVHGEWFRRTRAIERLIARHAVTPAAVFESRDDSMHMVAV